MRNNLFRLGILVAMLAMAVGLCACAKQEAKYNAKPIKLAKLNKSDNRRDGKRKDGNGKSENETQQQRKEDSNKNVQKQQQETVKQQAKQVKFDTNPDNNNRGQQQAKVNRSAGRNQGDSKNISGKRGNAGKGNGSSGAGDSGAGNRGADGNGAGNGNVGNSPDGKDGEGDYSDGKPGRTVKKPKIIYTIKNQN